MIDDQYLFDQYRKLAAAVVLSAVEALARRTSDGLESKVFRLHLEGYGFSKIAKLVDRPPGSIRNIIERFGPDERSFLLNDENPFVQHCGIGTEQLRKFVMDIEDRSTEAEILLGRIR
jgi:hypothetical protein